MSRPARVPQRRQAGPWPHLAASASRLVPWHHSVSGIASGVGSQAGAAFRVVPRCWQVARQTAPSRLVALRGVGKRAGIALRFSVVNVVGSVGVRPESDPQAPLVLVVEDDEVIRDVVTDVLDDRGFRILAASNGREALEHLDNERPDVLVLDLLMPVMHGWAFMENYARKTNGAQIPIVVLSVNPVLPRSFDQFGVRHCLGKPFQVDELIRAVEGALSSVAA
jgi:two-component system chemotaxis response regulator CheY